MSSNKHSDDMPPHACDPLDAQVVNASHTWGLEPDNQVLFSEPVRMQASDAELVELLRLTSLARDIRSLLGRHQPPGSEPERVQRVEAAVFRSLGLAPLADAAPLSATSAHCNGPAPPGILKRLRLRRPRRRDQV